MKDEIKTLGKKARKKNANPKDIKSLNRVNKAAACFVEIYNKMKDEDFSTLKKWTNTCKIKKKKKTIKSLTVSVVKIILKAMMTNKKLGGKNEIMTLLCV